MAISRRNAIAISGSTLAGLSTEVHYCRIVGSDGRYADESVETLRQRAWDPLRGVDGGASCRHPNT